MKFGRLSLWDKHLNVIGWFGPADSLLGIPAVHALYKHQDAKSHSTCDVREKGLYVIHSGPKAFHVKKMGVKYLYSHFCHKDSSEDVIGDAEKDSLLKDEKNREFPHSGSGICHTMAGHECHLNPQGNPTPGPQTWGSLLGSSGLPCCWGECPASPRQW